MYSVKIVRNVNPNIFVLYIDVTVGVNIEVQRAIGALQYKSRYMLNVL